MRNQRSATARTLTYAIGVWLGVATLASAQSGLRQGLPEDDLPTFESIDLPAPTPAGEVSGTRSGVADPTPSIASETNLGDHLPGGDSLDYEHNHIFDLTAPALTESSGTWLRRGWWYTRLEAVAHVRRWDRDNLDLATDPTGVVPTVTDFSPSLSLDRSAPGREGSFRATLGRFLFRDTQNRDHTAEFTFFGGGDFAQSENIIATAAVGLVIPTTFTSGLTPSFTGAEASQVEYRSRFNSFEWNYVVTTRPGRDRMELQPDGEWVRRQNSGVTLHGLFGLRYLNLEENLDWTATEGAADFTDVATAVSGRYDIDTHNNLFGPQFGGGVTQEWDRMSLTIGGKLGVLANYIDTRERLSFSDGTADIAGVGFDQADEANTLPFLLQFGVTGRWHMRPNVSIRAGYDMLFITALALAPQQVDFRAFDDATATGADSFYHGISLGVEGFW